MPDLLRRLFTGLRGWLGPPTDEPEVPPDPLPPNFPQVQLTVANGQYWRIHPAGLGAWYFASIESHANPEEIGRFDLRAPMGTCYVGAYDDAVTMEAAALKGLSEAERQAVLAERNMSPMALDEFYGKRIADFTSPEVERFGAPSAIELLDRADARPWAQAAHDGGFVGIRYRLRKDPEHRIGLALFGKAGPGAKPVAQGDPQPYVVRQARLAHELAGRQFTGDPLAE